jgi:hypothetical protein
LVAAFGLTGGYRFATIVVGAVVFLAWYFSSLAFTTRHPDIALLDGAEWTAWKRFEATAKGLKGPSTQPVPNPSLIGSDDG